MMNSKQSYGATGQDSERRRFSFGIRTAVSPYDEQGVRVPAISFVTNNNKGRSRTINGNGQAKRNAANHGKKINNPNWRRKVNSGTPRKIVTEKVIVDCVSPGINGNELYLYSIGDFVNVDKPEGQPLIIDPNRVTYTGGKEKEGEEKELWEKLCSESSLTITFDASNWEVIDIVSDEALMWARGQSPPHRRRSSWANTRYGSREQNKGHERKTQIKGGSPPGRSREKVPKPDPTKRRGSLPSVREFKAAVLAASAPTNGNTGISEAKEDFESRMEKLEQANMALQQQLEEAKSKIKVLEDIATTQDPKDTISIVQDTKASPVL